MTYPTTFPPPPPPQTPTTIPNPPLLLRRATRSDLPPMARLLALAFLDFELYDHFLASRREDFEQYYRYLLMRLREIWAETNTRFYLVEVSGASAAVGAPSSPPVVSAPASSAPPPPPEIIGFAAWEANGATHPLATSWRAERNTISNALERLLLPLEKTYVRNFLNRVADHTTLAHLRALLHHNFDSLPYSLHLQFLVTHPAHRGVGAGKTLLQHGLGEFARPGGLPVVLESSLMGRGFYERAGFRVVKWVWVGRVAGGRGTGVEYHMPVMMWEPEGLVGTWIEGDGEGGWRLKGSVEVGVEDGGLV